MPTFPSDLKHSLILLDGHEDQLSRFLEAGWIIVETKKQRKAEGDAFNDELEIILAAPEGVKVPDAVKRMHMEVSGGVYRT
jgi:hypothetical protein